LSFLQLTQQEDLKSYDFSPSIAPEGICQQGIARKGLIIDNRASKRIGQSSWRFRSIRTNPSIRLTHMVWASQPADFGIPNRLTFNSSRFSRACEKLAGMARKRRYRSKFRTDVIRSRMTDVSGKNGHCRETTDLHPTRQGTQIDCDQKHDRNKRVAEQDSRIVIFNFAFGDIKVRMFKDCHGLDLQKNGRAKRRVAIERARLL
jgi:hypothetical protein